MPDEKKYFGSNLNWEEYDERMIKHIRSSWIEIERSLFNSKWFDYRQLHPAAATYLFASEYETIYRRVYRQNIDHKAAEHIRVLKKPDIFDAPGAHLSCLWRARQIADAAGIPYDAYLAHAFAASLRYWNREHLPQPSNLYHERVVVDVVEKWEEQQSSQIRTAETPYYRNENYAGLASQNDHHEWLFSLAMKRDNPAPLIGRFLTASLLTIEKVRARLGQEASELALSFAA